MGRNIEDIIAKLPRQRRLRVNRKARQMAGEMTAYADSLGSVRKAVSKTQSEMGAQLGMPQNAISQLEKRTDLLVSTLVRYVDALGGKLNLVVQLSDGTEIVLEKLGRTVRSAKKSPPRKKSISSATRRAA